MTLQLDGNWNFFDDKFNLSFYGKFEKKSIKESESFYYMDKVGRISRAFILKFKHKKHDNE